MNTCNGKKCTQYILIAGLAILAGINLYNYFSPNLYRDVEIQQAGGKENWNKLKEVFATDTYKANQKARLEQVKQLLATETPNQGSQASDDTPKSEAENGTSVLEALAKYKEVNKFVHGPEDARFTILEFSELLCPYCKSQHNNGTIQAVIDKFPWEVNTINIGLRVHSAAQKLQEGLLCAIEQKDAETYYTFIGKLFEESSLSPDTFLDVAKRLDYDTDAMKKCMDEGRYADVLEQQKISAHELFRVTGTPGNVIIDTKTGKYVVVSGARPVSSFVSQIEALKALDNDGE